MNIELEWIESEHDYKTIDISPIEAVTIYNRIQEQCLYIANQFAKETARAFKGTNSKFDMRITINGEQYSILDDCGYGKRFDTLESIDGNCFKCSYEYNNSCHCHPEYTKFTQQFPIELLDLVDESLENKLRELTNQLKADWDKKH